MIDFYTYVHFNKNNKPIYVGKGRKDRAYSKRQYGEEYTVKIIDKNLTEDTALELEEFLIEQIGLDNLYNVFKRGHNQVAIKIDYRHKYLRKQINSLRTKIDILRFTKQWFADAVSGNDLALQRLIQWLPKPLLRKIKELADQTLADKGLKIVRKKS